MRDFIVERVPSNLPMYAAENWPPLLRDPFQKRGLSLKKLHDIDDPSYERWTEVDIREKKIEK